MKKTVQKKAATTPVVEKSTVAEKKTTPVKITKKPSAPVEQVVKEVPKVDEVDKASDNTVEEKALGDTLINEITDKISSVQIEMKSIQQTLKLLVKEYEKQKKIIAKVQKKRDNAKKSPSGFAKPCKISTELCKFVGIPDGSERSRTDSKGGDVITEADTGTRKASAEVQDLTTYYISKTLGDGGMYGLLGMHTATIASKTTLPNATYGSDDITGIQYGLGYAFDNGLRYEVSYSDFEGIELKDSTNVDTTGVSKITADLDVYMMKISYAF